MLGNGSGGFGAATTYAAAGIYPTSVTTADVNGDGKADLVVANAGGVAVLLNASNVTVTAIGAAPQSGTRDVGQSVTFTATLSQAVSVTGSPTLTLSNGGFATYDAATSTATGLVFDYTVAAGQSTADLQVTGLALYGGTIGDPGSLGFGAAASYASGSGSRSVTTADRNGDSRADLVVADYRGSIAVLLGNGSGGFGTATSYAAGSSPQSVAAVDLNGDGKADLVVADIGGGVAVLLGDGSGGFGTATTYAAGPRPISVTTADVNGDGKADLVAAIKVAA